MGLFSRGSDRKRKDKNQTLDSDKNAAQKSGGAEAVIESWQDYQLAQLPKRLPVLGISGNVIYPFTVTPVYIEEEGAKKALAAAQKNHQGLVVALAIKSVRQGARGKSKSSRDRKESEVAGQPRQPRERLRQGEISPAQFYHTGSVCLIHKIIPTSKKGAMVILQGLSKTQVLEFVTRARGYWEARISVIPEESREVTQKIEALSKSVLKSAQELIAQTPYLPVELQIALESLSDPLKLAYMVMTLVRVKVEDKQRILELSRIENKLTELLRILQKELEMLAIGGRISDEVKRKFTRLQREAYLREQLKAIKKELGEDGSEVAKQAASYQRRLQKIRLPKPARVEVEREIKRLGELHPMSHEYQNIRTYLDLVLDLPWDKESRGKIDLDRAQKQLDRDHYDLAEPKERILEYLAVRKLKNEPRGPILCLVGPPGVGKTSLGQSIAKSLGRKFVRMSLGGMRDEAEIRGHRRTYVGALPGRILQSLRRAGERDPVFMLDEIDKVGTDFRGDPASALLEVLDPEQNKTFRDHYLDLDFDLSRVLFIATANSLEPIQPALRDRMEVIKLPGYTRGEKVRIAKKFLVPKVRAENGLKAASIRFQDRAIQKIINEYTKEAGVRNLERELGKICRKVVRGLTAGGNLRKSAVVIKEEEVERYLGPRKVFDEVARRVATPGVVTALGVSAAGGEIMFVEAAKMPGKKGFLLTGQLGDVMKESAKTALSLVRSRAKKLDLNPDFFNETDIHLHVPAGGTPKDGPSAGVAMVTALASLLSGRPARADLAMTGEITLSGQVLPIGGVKEKVLAAKQAGISSVILPKKNQGDVGEIDDELKKGLNFIFVESVDEVLGEALVNPQP